MNTDDWEGEERRSGARPTTGDRRRCPQCADVMRFYERHVVHKGAQSSTHPAWVCRCGFEQQVRTDSLPPNTAKRAQKSRQP